MRGVGRFKVNPLIPNHSIVQILDDEQNDWSMKHPSYTIWRKNDYKILWNVSFYIY
jgi:hypothetical protein